jgi:hypothetical protein
MTWMKGLAAAGLAAVLAVGCSDRRTETAGDRAATATQNAGDRTAATAERAGERTENAMERAGDRTAAAGQEAAQGTKELGQEIAGTVKNITNDTLELGDRQIKIDDETEFYRDGQRIERDQIQPGDEVRAAFDEAGDELKAKRVEVQKKMESK